MGHETCQILGQVSHSLLYWKKKLLTDICGGTGTTVLTYPRSAPRGTGKAGENGQHSGEVGGSSAWTRPSAPECGDTLKALAGDQRPI